LFCAQAQELSEASVKIGLLEKKVESTDNVIASRVAAEKEETEKMKRAKDNQERLVVVVTFDLYSNSFRWCDL
jgi:hypothetical protein